MKITNFKFTSLEGKKYIINGEVDYLHSSGYVFINIDSVNGEKGDSLVLRGLISHSNILNHIQKHG